MSQITKNNRIKGNTGKPASPSPLVGEGRGEGASLLNKAKRLRRNMTDAEQKLWVHLRAKRFARYKFKRQAPMQRYIADFVCFESKLIVELDGGQHAIQQDYDKKRDEFFASQGFKVLRFWNNEVMGNMEGVLLTILDSLRATPLPHPSPTRGEGSFNDFSPTRGEGLSSALASPSATGREWLSGALASPSPLVGEGRGEEASA